jgi:hypothetical protein
MPRTGVRRCKVKTTDPNRLIEQPGPACPEIELSRRLAALARDAEAAGFPFTAEHLRHLAGYVLDETALKYTDERTGGDDDAPDPGVRPGRT